MNIDRKLKSQIEKLRLDPLKTPKRTPVLLSDSKGFCLERQVRVNPERFFEFWCFKSYTASDSLLYLQQNLQSHVQRLGNITLFVWIGTCNLTTKTGKFIDVTSHDSSSAYSLIEQLKEIYKFVRTFGDSVKLVFVHIPVYSIYHFNCSKGRDWDNYEAKDVILHKNIAIVNQYIDDINRILQVYSPSLSDDLVKSKKKSKKKVALSRVKYSYTFDPDTDGLHPGQTLSKLWLTRLCRLVHKFCY